MPYVSDELTHFVGRSLPTDQDRLDLLCRIITTGELLDPSHIGRQDRIFIAGAKNVETGKVDAVEYSSDPNVRHDLSSTLSNNQLVQFEIVCFCDIPLSEVAVHCTKYSYFGLAFSKNFLIKQGASPVMYVPRAGAFSMCLRERHMPTGEHFYDEEKKLTRAQLFDELFQRHNALGLLRYQQLERELMSSTSNSEVDEVVRKLRTMLFYQTAMEANMFGHLKFFDPSLPSNHADNYYMEREWRVSGRVKFTIGDIQRVLVPPGFVGFMLSNFPELGSCITPLAAG